MKPYKVPILVMAALYPWVATGYSVAAFNPKAPATVQAEYDREVVGPEGP